MLKQTFNHWATSPAPPPTPALFCFGYFPDRVSCFCPELASDHDPPTYSLLYSWVCRHAPPHLVYLLRWENHWLFAWTGLKLKSSWTLFVLSSWDYSHEALHLAPQPKIIKLAKKYEYYLYSGKRAIRWCCKVAGVGYSKDFRVTVTCSVSLKNGQIVEGKLQTMKK
jgi:hypothetical protein